MKSISDHFKGGIVLSSTYTILLNCWGCFESLLQCIFFGGKSPTLMCMLELGDRQFSKTVRYLITQYLVDLDAHMEINIITGTAFSDASNRLEIEVSMICFVFFHACDRLIN